MNGFMIYVAIEYLKASDFQSSFLSKLIKFPKAIAVSASINSGDVGTINIDFSDSKHRPL